MPRLIQLTNDCRYLLLLVYASEISIGSPGALTSFIGDLTQGNGKGEGCMEISAAFITNRFRVNKSSGVCLILMTH